MQKVKVLVPSYWEKFICIGSACEDNCCEANWDIYLDKNTYNLYRGIKDPLFQEQFKERVKRVKNDKADDKNYAKMLLDEDGKCKWLENGMCAIQLKYGFKYLCSTCLLFPRKQLKNFFGILESALSMACPEAIRVGLYPEEPMTFTVIELENTHSRSLAALPVSSFNENINILARHAPVLRKNCIEIMQTRTLSVANRIFATGVMLNKLREISDTGNYDAAPAVAAQYVEAVKQGQFNDLLSTFADNEEIKASIKEHLFNSALSLEREGKYSFKNFIPCVERLAVKLKKKPEEIIQLELSEMVESAASKFWADFLERRSHVLENYFVNYIFGNAFPFALPLGIQHQILLMAEAYALFRILLCSPAEADGYITEENIIRTITDIFRHTSHSSMINKLTETYIITGMDSLAHVSFMLRD